MIIATLSTVARSVIEAYLAPKRALAVLIGHNPPRPRLHESNDVSPPSAAQNFPCRSCWGNQNENLSELKVDIPSPATVLEQRRRRWQDRRPGRLQNLLHRGSSSHINHFLAVYLLCQRHVKEVRRGSDSEVYWLVKRECLERTRSWPRKLRDGPKR